MPFQNREQAARLLAKKLINYKGQNPLVLAIPRGAVPMAKIIADILEGELDVVLVRKLRAPGYPELAIGSVDEAGHIYLAEHIGDFGIQDEHNKYIEGEKRIQMETLRRRRNLYTPVRPPISPANRIVIVVDDGIATGSTMIAALRAVRANNPAKLIVATAVAPLEALRRIEKEADEVVCLEVPPVFFAIGDFFEDFSQVSDEEVVAILQQSNSKHTLEE
ncbi:MAG TPA: phosphoribosyltransferase family protein [Candidatus Limnocylindrales bacterium]|nr:phosphoribosyltransferase family protein [Candidatus Limnocylindrales bacterium]